MITTRALTALAESGHSEAQFRLGYRLAFGRNRPRPTKWELVVHWWGLAAASGFARAQFYLGMCYDHGHGVCQDLGQAMKWYRKAAISGHETAQYNLARGYEKGEGVRRSYRSMIHWLRKAAANGEDQAQNDLGYAYFYGHDVRKSEAGGRLLVSQCRQVRQPYGSVQPWLVLP